MKEVLKKILPKILAEKWIYETNYFIRAFEGKSDLFKSLPRQIMALSKKQGVKVGVVVLHDQDSADCKLLKARLIKQMSAEESTPRLVRIICRELESWYIGDFKAISQAYPNFKYINYINKAKFRNPETCNAEYELSKILPEFQKISSAKAIAPFLKAENNRSESFKQFVSGIQKFTNPIKHL